MWKAASVFSLLLLGSSPALSLDETVEIASRAISDEAFLSGDDAAAAPITVTGTLTGPDSTTPVPLVILMHGSDGPRGGAIGNWRLHLNRNGVTTLSLDSYTGRGLEDASADQDSASQFAQIYDAYRAADALAADPRIDGSRIVLMGFSRGGTAALYSAMTRFQEAFGPGQASIVAHIPFYPVCNFELKRELEVTAAPIRVFHGLEDDWTLAAPCRDYTERLRGTGADAEMTEFPGARHAFDNPRNPAYYSDSANQTSRNCSRREEDGQILNAETGLPFTYQDACVEYGPSVQYNDAATIAAQEAVLLLLADL